MWWQILPPMGIITVCITIPSITCRLSAYLYYGSEDGRELNGDFLRYRFFRDERLYGRPVYGQHTILGLDLLDD